MPQTVFDVGDLITSRLKLGVTPDGSTVASVVVRRPDGTALAGLATTAWAGDEKTVQFYATDDGTAGGTATPGVADGDWLAVWTVTGTGASVTPKVYSVAPLPGTGIRPAWSPFLAEVADFVPWLTVDTVTPGSTAFLGTFTGQTAPSDEQAQRHVDRARTVVAARLGTIGADLQPLARSVVALKAAASLARSFPRNRADVDTADQLTAQAAEAWTELKAAVDVADTAPALTPGPVMYAPAPNWWGDVDL